jgi:copper oxidase (laccase) domain-containing protein
MFKKQLHSTDILGYQTGAILQEGDGIFSNQSGVALGLRVADCNVIAIMGKKRFGIIHAGRK